LDVNFSAIIMGQLGEMVYLVDDDARVRKALSELLASFSVQVVSFESADAYLNLRRVDTAACLILDLQLPGMDGLELQRKIMDGCPPPIIFISGRGSISATVQAMKAGAIEFFTKPVDSEALVTAVSTAFNRDRLMRQQRITMTELERRLSQLSAREREVLPLVVSGLLNKQSAAVLGISEVTLQVHRSQIMRKMAAKSFADLVRMADTLNVSNRRSGSTKVSDGPTRLPSTLVSNP
jgi:FixJ family two-component response regulator